MSDQGTQTLNDQAMDIQQCLNSETTGTNDLLNLVCQRLCTLIEVTEHNKKSIDNLKQSYEGVKRSKSKDHALSNRINNLFTKIEKSNRTEPNHAFNTQNRTLNNICTELKKMNYNLRFNTNKNILDFTPFFREISTKTDLSEDVLLLKLLPVITVGDIVNLKDMVYKDIDDVNNNEWFYITFDKTQLKAFIVFNRNGNQNKKTSINKTYGIEDPDLNQYIDNYFKAINIKHKQLLFKNPNTNKKYPYREFKKYVEHCFKTVLGRDIQFHDLMNWSKHIRFSDTNIN